MPDIVPPRRVLLIQLRRAGDVVVSTALLEDLHRAFPGVHCAWMAGDAAALLEHHPLIAELHMFDHRDLVGMSRVARRGGYDWVIDVQGSWRTAVATAASRARVRAGWRGWNRGWAYTHSVRRAPRGSRVYVVTDRRRLLAALGVAPTEAPPRLYLTEHERKRGERRIRQLAAHRPVVGIIVSTSNPAKDWAPQRFADVAASLAREGATCIVFSTPGSERQVEAYHAALGDSAIVDRLNQLRVLMERIAACDLLVSGDTGPAHIATALGVPRVTIYGPTPAEGWTPDSPDVVAVRDVAARCDACAERSPGRTHTCLATVTPEMVLGPVRILLQRHSSERVVSNDSAATRPQSAVRSPQSDLES